MPKFFSWMITIALMLLGLSFLMNKQSQQDLAEVRSGAPVVVTEAPFRTAIVVKVIEVKESPGMKHVVLAPDDRYGTTSAWTAQDIKAGDRVDVMHARVKIGGLMPTVLARKAK